ncbi:VanZ family protein [Clostridium sp. 19966]|uniref:VanZ family protein n=1 Tax=Clostridium sp. 19966 TaxID=2768166 RepID=UPI0028DEF1A3|nr:VanZ family protein [Clostridium sp. 19966]MDT8719495.1 VanZ family protein [Clostridium sp. 19966]
MDKRRIKLFLLIIWLILIFMFSNQPAVVSDGNSHFVIYIFDKLGLNMESVFGNMADFLVRKAAHFSEYFILYILIFNVMRDGYTGKKLFLLSLLGVFLYACTDEFHQIFIPGRTAKFRDVLIDTSGGAVSMCLTYLFLLWKKSVKVYNK